MKQYRFFARLGVLFFWAGSLFAQDVELVVPTGHTKTILRLAVSPGGGLLASSSIDETVKVFETATGKELYTFRPGKVARDLAFSHDGRYLAVAAFNIIHVLDLRDFSVVREIKGWNTNAVRFHSERNELFFLTQKTNSVGDDPWQFRRTVVPDGNEVTLAAFEPGEARGIAALDYFPGRQDFLIVLSGELAYRVSEDGGKIAEAHGARGFTPDGRLFFLNKEGTNAAMGVREIDGSQQWKIETTGAEVENPVLTSSACYFEGKVFWVNRDDRIASGDFRTGALAMSEMPAGSADYAIAVGPDGSLYVGTGRWDVHRYRLPSLANPEVFGERVLKPSLLLGAEKGQRLTWGFGRMSSLRIDRHHVIRSSHEGAFSAVAGDMAPDGGLLVSRSDLKDLFTYLVPGRHVEAKRFATGMGIVRNVSTSAASPRLLVVSDDGLLVLNTDSDKTVKKFARPESMVRYGDAAAISPDGTKALVAVVRKIEPGSDKTRTHCQLIDLGSGQVVWESDLRLQSPKFSADGKQIVGEIFEAFVALDAATGKTRETFPLPDGRFPYRSISNDPGSLFAYTHDDRAYLYDLSTRTETRLIVPGEDDLGFNRQAFFGDDFIAFAGNEGVVRLFDARSNAYVAALVQYERGDDWAIIAADGRFDATPGAMEKMYYRVGQQVFALEQLFEGFYTPGLAGAIFGRIAPGVAPPPVNIANLSPPPTVKLEFQPGGQRGLVVEDDVPEQRFTSTPNASATMILTGDAPGGAVTALRLYQNGKLVGDGVRGLVVEDDPEPAGNTRSIRVNLVPGMNEFKAVAVNHQRTESVPARLLVKYEGAAVRAQDENAPDAPVILTGAEGVGLHIVTIGIDKYQNETYNLNYATADANGIEKGLQAATQTLVGESDFKSIRNESASRETILKKLEEIIAAAGPEDLFVFYYAGHGVVVGEEDRVFYLVPHDVTDIYGDDASVAERGISAAEIQRAAAAISAQRQLYILDACHSAGALETLEFPGAAENKAIAQLARRTGTHWLTSTASDQFASEFDELGHGAFTYVLLEAVRGEAAAGDGVVTVEELKRYLRRQVPVLTEKHTGLPQYPSSYGFGRDFDIAVPKK